MKKLSVSQTDNLISDYLMQGGVFIPLREGVLRHGDFILYDPNEKLKFFVSKEVYINEWSSDQTLRGYNKVPKKYLEIIENS